MLDYLLPAPMRTHRQTWAYLTSVQVGRLLTGIATSFPDLEETVAVRPFFSIVAASCTRPLFTPPPPCILVRVMQMAMSILLHVYVSKPNYVEDPDGVVHNYSSQMVEPHVNVALYLALQSTAKTIC